jgi:hypothetical protein
MIDKAFDFTKDDLKANRALSLSPRQQDMLNQIYEQRKGWWWQTILLVVGIQGVGMVISLFAGWATLDELLRFLLPVGVFLGTVFLFATLHHLWKMRTLRNGSIRVIEGTARPHKFYSRYGWVYQVRIGRRTIPLMNEQQYEAFTSGQKYRLYTIPVTPMVILSIEPQ